MKIAYFTDTFLPQVNGIATALANQARELGKRGHQVLIFTPNLDDIPRQRFKAKNVTVVHLPAIPALLYTEFKVGVFGLPKVIRFLTRFKPDIIHLHSPFTIGMDAIMAAKLLKKPLIGTVHIYFADSDYLKVVKSKLAVKLLNKIAQKYLKFLFNQCDLILAPSKLLVQELNGASFKRTIKYLPNGIVLNNTKPLGNQTREQLKKKYGLKEKVVLHFGRLSYEKSIDVLIKAFHTLAQKHNNVSLLIIGDGPAKTNLIKLAKKLRLEKEVVFTGFIGHQILISSRMLTLGDIFATASTMEANPMVVLEAMLFGLPIVGVKQAGLIELVSANGFLVPPGNTKELAKNMEKILFNQNLSENMAKKSLAIVKNYSIDKTTDKLLAIYEELILHPTRH
ncbi:glycosyltransferase [Candidatus Daviesbacteria bacterium]|nr:glycosyltransferase [Candidatus Daviesbacteria bacterium]